MERKINVELNVKVKDYNFTRVFPKSWEYNLFNRKDRVNVLNELSDFCMLLYNHLLYIKEDYEKEFNADNSYTIDEYIALFNNTYEKIFSEMIVPSEVKRYKKKMQEYVDGEYINKKRFRFIKEDYFIKRKVIKDYFMYSKSFRDQSYNKLAPLVKKLFMIEKMCSFTTRKFWQNELTPIENFDINKPFKILAKVVFPNGWRYQKVTHELKTYYNKRIYSSASLIDQDHMTNLFNYGKNSNVAVLILQCDADDIICASSFDTYSEELINNENPFEQKTVYTDIFLQDVSKIGDDEHKMYAEALEIATPKSILKHSPLYSEVNLKNAKVVGVFVPNKYSFEFSEDTAKKYNVPLYVPNGVEKEMPTELEFEEIFGVIKKDR